MKRDMELMRKILLACEELDYDPRYFSRLELEGYTDHQVGYHVILLAQAGYLVEAGFPGYGYVHYLTWSGHELLEAIRDEGRWKRVLAQVREKGGGLVFEVAVRLLMKAVEHAVS